MSFGNRGYSQLPPAGGDDHAPLHSNADYGAESLVPADLDPHAHAHAPHANPTPAPIPQSDTEKFSTQGYKDVWAAVAFVAHVIVFLIAGFAMVGKHYDELTAGNSTRTVNSTDTVYDYGGQYTLQYTDSPSNTTTDDTIRLQASTVYLALISLVISIAISIGWLMLAKAYPKALIYIALYADVLISCLIVIACVAAGQWVGVVVFAILIALKLLWIYWMRERIAFAAKMLKYAIAIVHSYPATVLVAFISILLQCVWIALWGISTVGFYYTFSKTNDSTADKPQQEGNSVSYVIVFLCFLSFYWTSQVLKYIVHVTSAGVAASWYFVVGSGQPLESPTKSSFKRAMTTSFGSVCLAALVIAVVRALRATVNVARNNNGQSGGRGGGGGAIVAAVLLCLLSCLLQIMERVVEYVNQYALAQVAIYGKSYFDSAKATWELFKVRGFDALLNDSVIGTVLGFACLMGGLSSALACGVVAEVVFDGHSGPWLLWAFIGFFIGFALTMLAVEVIDSSVITLFVCLCEDPAALQRTKPEVYDDLVPAIQQRYPTITFFMI